MYAQAVLWNLRIRGEYWGSDVQEWSKAFQKSNSITQDLQNSIQNALGPTKVQQEFCKKWMVYWHAVFDLSLMYIVICYAVVMFPHWMFYEGQELICGGRLGQLLHLILLILSVGIPRESVAQNCLEISEWETTKLKIFYSLRAWTHRTTFKVSKDASHYLTCSSFVF